MGQGYIKTALPLKVNMWIASPRNYEKVKSRIDPNQKYYAAVLINTETREQKPTRKKFKTVTELFEYVERFNRRPRGEKQTKNIPYIPSTSRRKIYGDMLRSIYTLLGNEWVQGPDIARYEIWFDPDLSTLPINFAVQKLTEGTTYIDTSLETLWTGMAKVSVRGGYHYIRSGMSWQAQADFFLSVASRHDYHFLAIDLEGTGNIYSDTFFADTRRMIDYCKSKTGKKVLLYTNGSTYVAFATSIKKQYVDGQVWLDALDFWYAWPSLTALTPSLPLGCKTWKFWQYRWDMTNVGTGAPSDWNRFNGTVAELMEWAGIATYTDSISYPFDGVKHVEGSRDGWNFSLDISDPSKVEYEFLHGNLIQRPSFFSKQSGRRNIFLNGGDWSYGTSMPIDLSVSNGQTYVGRTIGRPSLMVLDDNSLVIDTVNRPNVRQAISGVWYIVLNGQPFLVDGTEARYTEGHSRTVYGMNAAGHLMSFVSDGLYPNQGLRLRRCAEVMIQYGCVKAFDSGGGGDSVRGVDGVITTKPQNGTESYVPETVLIYVQETNMTTTQIIIGTTLSTEVTLVKDLPKGDVTVGKLQPNTPIKGDKTSGVLFNDNWIHLTSPINGWVLKSYVPNWAWTTVEVPTPPPDPSLPSYFVAYDDSNAPLGRYNKQ